MTSTLAAQDFLPRSWTRGWRAGLLALLLLLAVVASVGFPLLTYTLSLAMFGLAHVMSEMRFVRARFGERLQRWLLVALSLLLAGVVGSRVARIAGVIEGSLATNLELALVVALALCALPVIWRVSRAGFAISALLVAGLVIGLLVTPIHTLLLLAVLHNLTPMGFLVEVAPRRARGAVMALSVAVFVMIPLFIASGLPATWLMKLGIYAPDFSPLPTGPLYDHFSVYLPRSWHGLASAQHAFSAIVFAQVMHYVAVIHVLPRCLARAEATSVPALEEAESMGSRGSLFLLAMVGASAVLFVGFCFDFKIARSVYGVAAAVHAWIEVPILMIALSALVSGTADALSERG